MESASSAREQSQTASSSAAIQPSAAVSEDDLIASLWQELPTELLHKVLSKLPVSVLIKFLRVSKEWKALIQSETFARGHDSLEPTVFYFDGLEDSSHIHISLLNLKANIWEKHYLDFIGEDERFCYAELVAADGGLLCYKIVRSRYPSEVYEINLVVQNPVTAKWRRLIVPHRLETRLNLEMCLSRMMVGLIVNQEVGSYKLVVAFIDEHLSRKTYIYDSPSLSWTTTAAMSPVLDTHLEDETWEIPRSICWNGEVVWLVEEMEYYSNDPTFKSLIKYSVATDTWSVATRQTPSRGDLHIVHNAAENRLLMINSYNSRQNGQFHEEYFPPEFVGLVPGVALIDAEDFVRAVNKAGGKNIPSSFRPGRVVFGAGTWFIASRPYIGNHPTGPRSVMADVFAYTESSHTVVSLPKLYNRNVSGVDSFTATFKAFV